MSYFEDEDLNYSIGTDYSIEDLDSYVSDDLNDFFESDDYWNVDNEPDWSNSMESSSWQDDEDSNIWQQRSGRESPIQEEHLSHGKSINLIDFNISREIGESNSKAKRTDTMLLFCLLSRWQTAVEMEMLLDAKKLLQRKLYRWEGAVLTFLKNCAMKRTLETTKSRQCALLDLTRNYEGVVPVAFIDIVHILLRNGACLEARNDKGDDLLLSVCKSYVIYEDIADFVGLVLRRGYDVERNGDELVKIVCSFCHSVSNARLRVIKMLFGNGLKLAEATKRVIIDSFAKNVREQANRNGIKTLELLVEHGCHVNNALLTMGSLEPFYDFRAPDYFKCILRIVNVLLENGAQVISETSGELSRSCFLLEILRDAKEEPLHHPSLLELLKKCVARGLDPKVTDSFDKNLLMGFCECYSNGDLPEVVRFLCSNGIDVNSVDRYGKNALVYLSGNESANRQVVYETACVLVELDIDVRRRDNFRPDVLTRLLSNQGKSRRCCYFNRLSSTTEPYVWNMLDLFLKPGSGVGRENYDSYDAFCIYFDELSIKDSEYSVCPECWIMHMTSIELEQIRPRIRSVHFPKVLELAERLVEIGGPVSQENFDKLLSFARSKFDGDRLDSLLTILSKIEVVEPTDNQLVPEKKIRLD